MWKLEAITNEPFAYWNNAFTNDEIESIIKIGYSKILNDGTLLDKDKPINEDIRRSKVAWLEPNEQTDFIFRRITDIVVELNSKYFKYDLDHFENIQFTEYSEEYKGHYKSHKDASYDGQSVTRKLSFSIQLTDETEYDGGDLLLYSDNIDTPRKAFRSKGTLTVFPSYMLHQVEPVTRGKRNTLVSWVHGPRFR